jgi:DHA1 family multidrug resistance protein-like MFS transporter
MSDLIRDSPLGQLLRFATRNQVFKYRDELPNFTCPGCYSDDGSREKGSSSAIDTCAIQNANSNDQIRQQQSESPASNDETEEPLADSLPSSNNGEDDIERRGSASAPANVNGLWKIPTNAELQHRYSSAGKAERATSRPIVPVKTSDGIVLVDWWTTGGKS